MADLKPDEKFNPIECRRLIRLAGLYSMLPSSEAMGQMAHQMELLLRDMTGAEQRAKQAEDDLTTYKGGQARDSDELAGLAQKLAEAEAQIELLKQRATGATKTKQRVKKAEATPVVPADPDAPEVNVGQSPYGRR